jgi:hypothetical protein
MGEQSSLTEADVRALGGVAGLPLAAGRSAVVAPSLAVWVSLANELSRKMSEPEHRALAPVVAFAHPPRTGMQ